MGSYSKVAQANFIDKVIEISFPWHQRDVDLVKTLEGRKWNPEKSLWTVPLTEFHSECVINTLESHGFTVDSRIHRLAEGKKKVSVTFQMNRDGLFPFQSVGVDFIHQNMGRVIIGDDMGTGKTITALGWARERQDLKTIVIVCPASVVYKWENEIYKWVGDKELVQVVTSGNFQLYHHAKWTIISYALMVSKQQELRDFHIDLLILDEAHKIKDMKAQRSRCAHSLPAKYALLLTGTPMLNRPIELFSLLRLINPVEWKDWFQFAQRYCDAHKTYFGWDVSGASNLPELKHRLEKYMIRRTKKEVLDQLPELTRTRVPIVVKKAEIKAALDSLKHWVEENGTSGANRAEAVVRLSKLRQAIGLAKVPVVAEMVEDLLEQGESSKIVIYAVHHAVVAALAESLKKWGVTWITGEVSQLERQERIDKFQNRMNPRVMIISSAGGEGIDLYRSQTVLFCERDWTPGAEEQAEARCHRMGQKNAVEAIYPVADDTVDRDMDYLINQKREIFRELIGLDEVKTVRNSEDEFFKMLKGVK